MIRQALPALAVMIAGATFVDNATAAMQTLAPPAPAAPQAPTGAATPSGSTALGTVAVTAPSMSGTTAGYRLATGDKIRVTTYGEAALTGEFVVDSSGTVAFPLIGNLPAGGQTPQELQTRIEGELRNGYLKEPRVSVEVLTFRPFFILGEVNKPGTYVYADGLTILNAVAMGGGFTYRANKGQVYIKRAESAREQAYPLTADVPISPGDTIRIGERFF